MAAWPRCTRLPYLRLCASISPEHGNALRQPRESMSVRRYSQMVLCCCRERLHNNIYLDNDKDSARPLHRRYTPHLILDVLRLHDCIYSTNLVILPYHLPHFIIIHLLKIGYARFQLLSSHIDPKLVRASGVNDDYHLLSSVLRWVMPNIRLMLLVDFRRQSVLSCLIAKWVCSCDYNSA